MSLLLNFVLTLFVLLILKCFSERAFVILIQSWGQCDFLRTRFNRWQTQIGLLNWWKHGDFWHHLWTASKWWTLASSHCLCACNNKWIVRSFVGNTWQQCRGRLHHRASIGFRLHYRNRLAEWAVPNMSRLNFQRTRGNAWKNSKSTLSSCRWTPAE